MKKMMMFLVVFGFALCLCACAPVETTAQEPDREATTIEEETTASEQEQCVHDRWYTSPDYQAGFSYYTGMIDYPCLVEGCNGIVEIPNDSFSVEVEVVPDGLAVRAIGGLHTYARVLYWTESTPQTWEMSLEDTTPSPVEYYGTGSFWGAADVICVAIDVRDVSGWIVRREYTVTYAYGKMVLEETNA